VGEQRLLNFMRVFPDKPTRVLFINSALLAGADTSIHFLLLRNLPQDRFELHAAGQPGSPSPAFDELRTIPGIALRPTNFGPALWQRSNLQKLAGIAGALPAAASLLGLAAHIRRNAFHQPATRRPCVRAPQPSRGPRLSSTCTSITAIG
jgi:hypothetical protein